ncbi:MAG: hypothetical protein DMF71_19350 [Acidobacteria bacterium]|nr:MAG: hypothetical protein DMF71_19350 [Acidobacteriota bacterium]
MTADLFIAFWIDENIIPGDSFYYLHIVVLHLHRIVIKNRHPTGNCRERNTWQGIRAIAAYSRSGYVGGAASSRINRSPRGRINEATRARCRGRIKIPWQLNLLLPMKF